MSEAAAGPVEVIRARMRELRRKRGLTAAQLGEAMAAVGVAWDRSIVANFESGRRESVTVVELFALAHVLDVAPVHLAVPVDDDVPYQVTPTLTQPSHVAREWVRGRTAPMRARVLEYFAEAPEAERGSVEQWWRDGERMATELKELLERWEVQTAKQEAFHQQLVEQERRVVAQHERTKEMLARYPLAELEAKRAQLGAAVAEQEGEDG